MAQPTPTLPGIDLDEATRESLRADLRRLGDPEWRENFRRALRSRRHRPAAESAPVQMEVEG